MSGLMRASVSRGRSRGALFVVLCFILGALATKPGTRAALEGDDPMGAQSSSESEPKEGHEGVAPRERRKLVVGSKNFAESRFLAELFAQAIERHTGREVERRLNLAGTTICFDALRSGALDLYPEYTGTGLVALLDEKPEGDSAATLRRVRRVFGERYDVVWLAPLGFENAYELAVRESFARERELETISDLVGIAGELDAAFGYEFVERPDGLPGLKEVYELSFASVQTLQQALKVKAIAEGEVEVIDVYTTDGRIVANDLRVLEDDRSFFPPYEAAPLVRGATLREEPELGAALARLSGVLDEEGMRAINLRLQEKGDEPAEIARELLDELGFEGAEDERAGEGQRASGGRGMAGLLARRAEIGRRVVEHLALSASALGAGALFAIPLALALERRRAIAEGLIRAFSVTQTVPSIALLAFMIPLFGVGTKPAIVALFVYSLFPMLRNTYTGLRDASPEAAEAAGALGMTPAQVLMRVRLPLAAPVILAGVRTSAVLTIGTATLAALIGAGGLGVPIVAGLQLADTVRILSGAIPAALLAMGVDALLGLLERLLRPPGPA